MWKSPERHIQVSPSASAHHSEIWVLSQVPVRMTCRGHPQRDSTASPKVHLLRLLPKKKKNIGGDPIPRCLQSCFKKKIQKLKYVAAFWRTPETARKEKTVRGYAQNTSEKAAAVRRLHSVPMDQERLKTLLLKSPRSCDGGALAGGSPTSDGNRNVRFEKREMALSIQISSKHVFHISTLLGIYPLVIRRSY